ncbi:unnamed protein product (macronuclear) [Paramecium tetraurelia]|uniref:ADP/ATP translocase n=1 Tax=Paramecium tetraurelia TaxID=5888 RepID=A0EAU1_PARTE|nr:uncharacterized protein GSPATT00025142001 [Paramecium tetraurelia]CAK92408.1 unnamed protein product [Paramecium tetraurelia]|eukprot:XP_001459805.1 hypothetical protein (macronuclear) [Paramecium tetraurelia strain d4-2]
MADFLRDFLIGGFSAAVLQTVFSPFYMIKLYTSNDQKYKGIFDHIISFHRNQGFAMWRGNIIRIFPAQGLNFAFKDEYRKLFCHFGIEYPKKEKFLFFLGNIASGSAAGATSLIIFHPLDLGRTRLSADIEKNNARQFIDLTDCLSKVYKSEGFIGLYRYFGVSVMQVSLYRGLYFGAYDTAKETIFQQWLMGNIFVKCFVAFYIHQISDFILRPLDTIRQRMMMQFKRADTLYKNTLDCAVKIAKKEGTQAFFQGKNYSRGFQSFALVLYDESKQIIAYGSKSALDQ